MQQQKDMALARMVRAYDEKRERHVGLEEDKPREKQQDKEKRVSEVRIGSPFFSGAGGESRTVI